MDAQLHDYFTKGLRAARQGQHAVAAPIFQQVVAAAPDHELAWMWLALTSKDEADKQGCLSKVIALNPDNLWAAHQLAVLKGEVAADVDPFAPEQAEVEALQCPNCGGAVELQCEGTNTVVCRYCDSVVDLSAKQAAVVGKRKKTKPCQPITPGMEATLDGKTYLVIGWLRFKEISDGEVYRWEEWQLVAQDDGAVLWLCYEEEKGFTLSTRIPIDKAFDPRSVRAVPIPDGKAKIIERGTARISALDGELSWRAKIGDSFHYIDAAKGSVEYGVEYTDNEIELFRTTPIGPADLWRAFGKEEMVKSVESAQRSKSMLWILMVLGIVGIVFSVFAGKKIYQEQATVEVTQAPVLEAGGEPATDAIGETQAFPVLEIAASGRPHKLHIRSGSMAVGAWAVIDVYAVAEDDTRFYLGAAEMWHEAGRDSDGPWDESDYTGNCYFIPAEAGSLTLMASLEASPGITSLPVTLTVESGVWMTRFLVIFCVACFIGLMVTGGIKVESS